MASTTPLQIPEYLNNDFFRKVLQSGLRNTPLKILNVSLKDLTIGGENYCSNIYHATVKFRKVDDRQLNEQPDEPAELIKDLIVKRLPKDKQGALAALHIYDKESAFYLDIKPKMETLMWYARSSPEHWCLAASHIYSTTEPEENIVFEDLCQQGFTQQNREVGLDLAHSQLVIRKIAEYHALTMAITVKEPQNIVERYPYGLLNYDSIRSEPFKMLFGGQLLKLITLASEDPELSDIAKKLLRYYDKFTERVLKSVYPLCGEINVLNHGDLWVNNLFFKYTNTNNRSHVNEIRHIDFQLCFYGSLGFDINYFLNTSLQLDVLRQHRQSLIELYTDTLIATLKILPFHEQLPTAEQIFNEIRQREAYGFFVAFGFFPIMTMIRGIAKDNTLQNFHDEGFARAKINLMFTSNPRTLEILKYALTRFNDLKIFD